MNGQFPSHQPTSGLLLWGQTEKNPGIGSLISFGYGLTVFITSFLSSRKFSFLYYVHRLGCRNKIPPQQQALTLGVIDTLCMSSYTNRSQDQQGRPHVYCQSLYDRKRDRDFKRCTSELLRGERNLFIIASQQLAVSSAPFFTVPIFPTCLFL